jgi:hypothetical protein
MADETLLVDQITRPVAAEAALVVSADIKPLDQPHDGRRWFVPAGGVVFARDPGLEGNGPTGVMDAPGRAGQFPQVTAFLDTEDIEAHADSLFVLGVAPDGTRVTGDEVNRNRHTFSRISVQVAGTCTLAARKTEQFRFGDLVCASLLNNDALKFRGADAGFVTRNLQPWQPNQTRSPRSVSKLSPAAIRYNLLHGLQSIVAANSDPTGTGTAKLVDDPGAATESAFEVAKGLQESWSPATWSFLMARIDLSRNPGVNFRIEEFQGLAFDGPLKGEIDAANNYCITRSTSGSPTTKPGFISVRAALEAAAAAPAAAAPAAAAPDLGILYNEYVRVKNANDLDDSFDPRSSYGQAWRAVCKDTDLSDATVPEATATGVVSLTKKNQENLMACLFFEACGRGPLRLPADMVEKYCSATDGTWKTQLTDYCKMVDAADADAINAEIETHRRAALRWAGSTTAPFARVLEVGVNELRVELLAHLSAD